MSGDRKKFKAARHEWERLYEEQKFSAPSSVGLMAIMFSHYSPLNDEAERAREIGAFADEAEHFKRLANVLGKKATVTSGITLETLQESVLQRRDVSDVMLIGNGSFSHIWGDNGVAIDWNDLAVSTNHLKQGEFIQRFCGIFNRSLNTPFSTFAVTDPRKIYAPVGKLFAPEINEDDESCMMSITDRPVLSLDYIKTTYRRPVRPGERILL